MDISMSMLEWYLRDIGHTSRIEQDERCIKRLRFLFYDEQPIDPEYLYIAGMKEEISDTRFTDSYMILNRKSYIIFNHVDMNELLNRLLMAFDYFNNWERRLLELKAAKAPAVEFFRLSDEIIHNPMNLGDLNFNSYAVSDPKDYKMDPVWLGMEGQHAPMDDPYYDAETGETIRELMNDPRLVRNVYEGGAPVIMLYIDQNGEHIAILSILVENREMQTIDLQLARFFAEALNGSKELQESTAFKPKNQILKGLLDGDLKADDVSGLIDSDVSGPWYLVRLSNAVRTDTLNRHGLMSRILKNREHCVASIYRNSVMVLMGASDYDPELRFFKGLFDYSKVNILVSAMVRNLEDIKLVYRQLEYAEEIYGNKAGIFYARKTALSYYMNELAKDPLSAMFLHPALFKLEEYDRENETELTKTLLVYFSNGMSSHKTAESLFIHPNSMKYRLKRIKELTSITLEDNEELDQLRISCWLWQRIKNIQV